MSNFYADGRPASQGGDAVRYDAGGRAHTVPNRPDLCTRTRKVGTEQAKEHRLELDLMKAQVVDLGGQVVKLRNAMQEMLRVAVAIHDGPRGQDDYIQRQNLAEFVRMSAERALE